MKNRRYYNSFIVTLTVIVSVFLILYFGVQISAKFITPISINTFGPKEPDNIYQSVFEVSKKYKIE